MENLTGIRDVDKLILLNLNDKSLSQAALINTYVNSLMDESFWASRFQQVYGVTLWKYNVSHRDVYKEFSKLQAEELVNRVVDNEFIELIERLIKDSNKENLLIYAAKNGKLEVVELLLDNGVDIHADDDNALRWATRYGYPEICALLIEKGANIHAEGGQSLQLAARYGHLEVVKLLLDKGADIHADDYVLRWAAQNGHVKVVEFLLNKGAIADSKVSKLINKLDSILLKQNSNQCQGITKTGNRCKKTVINGTYCSLHNK